MGDLPPSFHNEYSEKGESFRETARLLYANHGHQYTQRELAAEVGVSQPRISEFTQELVDDGWLDKHDGQTTFVWNTQHHNPAAYEAVEAVGSITDEVLALADRSTRNPTEFLALVAVIGIVTGSVLAISSLLTLLFPVGSVSPQTYAVLAGGSGTGAILILALAGVGARIARRRS